MALILKLRSGDLQPLPELCVDAPRVVIGRAAGCELQLPDPSVSLRHASLRQRGTDYVVVDEGSENGTFSGSTRLSRQAPHSVSDGELLRFGRIWVEVRFRPGSATAEAGASRELARNLVEHALKQEGQPHGMNVSVAGDADRTLHLARPRHAYLLGRHKAADLRLPGDDLPARCLELRRHGDQLWVTLLDAELKACVDGRELCADERRLWPRGAALTLGALRLEFGDPTGEVLERLERDATERLAAGAPVDPPIGQASPLASLEQVPSAGDVEPEDEEGADEPDRSPGPTSSTAQHGPRWTLLEALICILALSMLGLSLWAIRWIAELGRA